LIVDDARSPAGAAPPVTAHSPAVNAPPVLHTERLDLRPLVAEDADFIVALLNDPEFIAHIGDRGIHDRGRALCYLEDGPWASYRSHGFGPWAVDQRPPPAAAPSTPRTIGICGFWQRLALDAPDLGFAFLPAGRGRGYALEAARATLQWASGALHLPRLLAVTTDDNHRSRRLLEALGMDFERHIHLPGDDAQLRLYGLDLAPARS